MALSVASPVLFLMIAAVILDIIAVAIPYWGGVPKLHFGLWKICVENECQDFINVPDIWKAARGLHMFGLIVGIAALVIYILVEVSELIGLRKRRMLCSILNLVAGAFILVADCYMSTKLIFHPACITLSLNAAFFFIYVGGNLNSMLVSTD